MYAPISVGIDVAKAHLPALSLPNGDVHLIPHNKRLRVANNPTGHRQLLGFILPARPDRVVLESTGGYEQAVLHTLIDAGVPTARVNPTDVRCFARGMRRLAKSDQQDGNTGRHPP